MYQLAPHVFACTTGRNCMFLDLRLDRYLSVPQELMDELAPQIHDWHLSGVAQRRSGSPQGELTQIINDLTAAGILRQYRPEFRPRRNPHPSATRDITSQSNLQVQDIPSFHRVTAFAALVSADVALRTLHLSRIIERIAGHTSSSGTVVHTERMNTACALTDRFAALRPWYPRNYLCLFDSLALTLFLMRHNIRAEWIFGVREDPFAAHCWVQYGAVVLNDHLDRTRLYTPIMTV